MKCLEHPKLKLIISEMFKTLRVFFNSFIYAESELNLVNIAWKSGQHIANKGGIFRRLWRNHFLLGQHGQKIWSTNWGTYPTRSARI